MPVSDSGLSKNSLLYLRRNIWRLVEYNQSQVVLNATYFYSLAKQIWLIRCSNIQSEIEAHNYSAAGLNNKRKTNNLNQHFKKSPQKLNKDYLKIYLALVLLH